MTTDRPALKDRIIELKSIGKLSLDECTYKNIEITLFDKLGNPRIWNYSAKKFGGEFFPGGKRYFPANHACKWWYERESCWQNFSMYQQDTRTVVMTIADHQYTLQVPEKGNIQPILTRAPETAPEVSYGANALQTIQKCENLADFKIIDEDGKTHSIHTQVIIPLWPYFATVVESGMTESRDRTLTLDYPTVVMDIVLDYLYGGVVALPEELALELLIFAKVYFIEGLERAAEKAVTGSSLEGDRCIISWKAAKQADNQVIRDYTACYFLEHVGHKASLYLCPGMSAEEVVEFQGDLDRMRVRQQEFAQ